MDDTLLEDDPDTATPPPTPPPDGDASTPAGAPEGSSSRFHARRWRKHKGFALLVGALAGGLAGYANTTLGLTLGLPFALYSKTAFYAFLVVLVAPVVEEHVKLFSLLLLRAEEQASYSPRRWLVLGALSGIGFGLAEAALYWQAIAPQSLTAANLNLGTRLLMTVPFHGLAVTASSYGYGLYRAKGSLAPLVRGLSVAIALHAAFNGFQMLKASGVIG